ncbi:MAG TPA: undecaprenyl-diphosphate phosphatase [Bacilli bacterium]|nr:undecaprenyl-diphosphate phosphatase [Bacilli bacterium]
MFLEYIKYFILGLVQGVAEILPISSSGHLALAESLLQIQFSGNQLEVFTVFLHFASLLALIIFMWPIIIRLIKGVFTYLFTHDSAKRSLSKPDFMTFIYLVVASIPVAVVGVFLEDKVASIFGNLLFIGIDFAVTGLILLAVSFLFKKPGQATYTWKNTFIAGLFQCIGVMPGISRSGITMSGAKIAGLDDNHAKEFAFLLFIPVALGSFVFSLDNLSDLAGSSQIPLYITGMVAAFIFTLLALKYIFKRFSTKQYPYFAYYMFAISLFTIVYYFVAIA